MGPGTVEGTCKEQRFHTFGCLSARLAQIDSLNLLQVERGFFISVTCLPKKDCVQKKWTNETTEIATLYVITVRFAAARSQLCGSGLFPGKLTVGKSLDRVLPNKRNCLLRALKQKASLQFPRNSSHPGSCSIFAGKIQGGSVT